MSNRGSRIPTIIIVNDDNPDLFELKKRLDKKVRVYTRDSIQGEYLYKIREGVIFFDHEGNQQFVLQDDYSKIDERLEHQLANISSKAEALLSNYLTRRAQDKEHKDSGNEFFSQIRT